MNCTPQPPCSPACPVHTDTRGYTQCIARGDYEGALDLLLQTNPFPSVCGRICHHPCEGECRRKEIDEPVSLRMLKRFVVENTREYRQKRRQEIEPSRKEKIAVIGSGPAGMTAAGDLVLEGYRVTVFEQESTLGGMLAHAVPRYRLPLEALQEDLDDILALGVEVKASCKVGVDISFQELRENHDAVVLAIGLSQSNLLPVPGADSEGVLPGIAFLWDVANDHSPALGERVLVVGGGNVAVDVARTARRLGVNLVTMACLESREEMPAWPWEIQEAKDEGISILNSWGPKAILTRDGKTVGMELQKCLRVFDDNGRFNPQLDPEQILTLDVNQVIVTIGQKSDLSCFAPGDVATERGRLVCDASRLSTSERGVFACGEILRGPGSAIQAVADGHRVAGAVHHFLQTGETIPQPVEAPQSIGPLPHATANRVRKLERRDVALVSPSERIKDFAPIEPSLSEEQALAEAGRCLACAMGAHLESPGACAGCLTCVRVCPFGVATVDRTAVMPAEQCQTCGLCAAECPAAAIALARFATGRMKEAIENILQSTDTAKISRPLVIAYCCLHETTSRKYLGPQSKEEIEATGVLRIMVPCVGRIAGIDLVSPFELGADRVAVIACKEDSCVYTGAEEILQRRIVHSQKFLGEIGVGKACLQFHRTRGNAEASWPGIWEEMKKEAIHRAAGE